jgi:hypothetical protein
MDRETERHRDTDNDIKKNHKCVQVRRIGPKIQICCYTTSLCYMTVCVDRAVQNKIVVSLAALLKNLCFAFFITVLPLSFLCTNMCFHIS